MTGVAGVADTVVAGLADALPGLHPPAPEASLEIITPAGIEQLFRRLAEPGGEYDPSTLPRLAGEYGCEVDFEGTLPLMERHSLTFG